MKRITWFGIFVVLTLVLVACSTAEEPTATPVPEPVVEAEEMEEMKSIVDIAVEDGRFTTLVAAVEAAGLAETLSVSRSFQRLPVLATAAWKTSASTIDSC